MTPLLLKKSGEGETGHLQRLSRLSSVPMSGENLRDLSNDTAEALLQAIKKEAGGSYGPAQLEQLANAYATVRGAAPRPPSASPRMG